jgi:tRNA (guanine26-N2/guanine27-N2)-dimethyltransferase
MKEIGLRILIGFLARQAARYNHSITPLLSYSKDHYYRVYLKMGKGVKQANETLNAIGWITKKKGEWKICKKSHGIGPLWLDKIHDKILIGKLHRLLKTKTLGKRWDITKFLHLIDNEADAPAFYYETDKIGSRLKKPQPKIIEVINKLRNNGFNATRTHFEQSGIKTEASLETLENIFSK